MNRMKLKSESGFTLLEILLVVVIISMLVGVAAVQLTGKAKEAKLVAARDQLHNYELALDTFELDTGNFPGSEQGLQALMTAPGNIANWKGPYLKNPGIRLDPWGGNYVFKSPGSHNPTTYDIYSAGPDRQEGTDDDIGNW